MSTTKTAARKMLPLTEQDLRDLATLRESETYRAALDHLHLTPSGRSEAQILHAVFAVGLKAIEEQVEAEAYAANAADFNAEMAERSAARMTRKRPASMDW